MAYEREAVSESASAIPSQASIPTREVRVIDPYSHSSRLAAVMAKREAAAGQTTTSGSSAVAETTPPAATVTLSPQVAALARKEQRFRQQEQALKAREEATDAKLAKIARLEAMEAKLAQKDYSGLDELVDYNEYSQYQINKLNGTDPNQEAIKALEAKIDKMTKSQEESTSKLFEAAVNDRRIAVNKLVETSQEFSGIKKLKAQEHVVQHILDTWEHDNIELSVEEAAKEVNSELLERAKRAAALLQPDAPAVDTKKQLPPLKQGLKTITNQVTTGEVTEPRKSLRFMSDSERWAEARRRAEAKLQRQG